MKPGGHRMAIRRRAGRMFLGGLPLLLLLATSPYPVDGYKVTGIRRLERLRLRLDGSLRGSVPVPGGRKLLAEVGLHLIQTPAETLNALPAADVELETRLKKLLSNRHASYSVAILDITPGRPIRFASQKAQRQYQPGSVGKIAIAAGLFTELKSLFPDSVSHRIRLLRDRLVTAGAWIRVDHHGVPLYNPADSSVAFRPIREGDTFSLYEWLDHMLSASSNAAASTVWKEVMLMRKFGSDYPPSVEEEDRFFDETPKAELRRLALSVVNQPLRDIGIAERDWSLGSFFTRYGKKRIGTGGSIGSPRGLLFFLMRLEQGRVVDAWSSLELKRLLYMTEKRIRYASAPRLRKSAVYFKSGSLYSCKEEPGFKCGKYMGNRFNYMNSVAIVEKPDGTVYLVALMSNVLRINSAVEHQTLATYIDRLVRK